MKEVGAFCSVWRALLSLLEESIFPWSVWRRRLLFEKSRAEVPYWAIVYGKWERIIKHRLQLRLDRSCICRIPISGLIPCH